jgi:hypothetical protein
MLMGELRLYELAIEKQEMCHTDMVTTNEATSHEQTRYLRIRRRWLEAILTGLGVNIIWSFGQYARRWLPHSWPVSGYVRWMSPGERGVFTGIFVRELVGGAIIGVCAVIGLWVLYPKERKNWRQMAQIFFGILALMPLITVTVAFFMLTLINLIMGRPLLYVPSA